MLQHTQSASTHSLGEFLKSIKEYGEGIALLGDAHDSRSLFIALFNRALACFRVGDDQRGLLDIHKAVAIDKDNVEAIEVESLAQRRMGLHNEAIEGMLRLAKHRREHIKYIESQSESGIGVVLQSGLVFTDPPR